MEQDRDSKFECEDCQPEGRSPLCKGVAIAFAVLVLIYDISPVDLIPDATPGFGWIDDFAATLIAGLNLYQRFAKDPKSKAVKVARYAKWILGGVAILVAVVLIALFLMGIVLIKG
jgi:hypothetical protein